jgi:Tol biopolymer transport system component
VAVATEVGKQSWADLQKAIQPDEVQRISAAGQTVLDQFKAGKDFNDVMGQLTNFTDYEKSALAVYLAQKEGAKEQIGTNWPGLPEKMASVIQIRTGLRSNGGIAFDAAIVSTLRKVFDLRISPQGTAIAYSEEGEGKDEVELLVITTNGTVPQLVEKDTSYCADWSPDGRALVYTRAANGSAINEIALGLLSRRNVLDAAGRIQIQKNPEDLAGLLFDVGDKVRCLGDGRIVFATADAHLPCTAADMPQHPQLFALDPERQEAIIPLIPAGSQDDVPAKADYYEPSPDGKQIAISGSKGAVSILNVVTGSLEPVQTGGDEDTVSVPSWRSNNEICFVSVSTNGQKQVVLRANATNRVISMSWPADARISFLDK